MNRFALLLFGSVALISSAAAQERETFERAILPFVAKYCVACHNDRSNSGGLDLTSYKNTKAFHEGRETWERILKRVALGSMPPRSVSKPPADETDAFVAWLRDEFARQDRTQAR